MANELIEGFGHISTGDTTALGAKGWTSNSGLQSSTPRFTGGQYWQGGGGASLYKVINAHATYTMGSAVNMIAWNGPIMGLLDTGTIQVDLRVNAIGQLYVTRNGTTILGPTAGSYAINTWYYMEMKALIDPSAGTVDVHVNGTSVLSGSSLNTRASGVSQANQVRWVEQNRITDIYANSGAGSAPDNTFWGDIRVQTLYPSGAGTTTQWTPSTGSNYTCVDEHPQNTSDYVSSSTANQIDTYAMDNLTAGVGTIYAVQAVTYDQKDDAGTRTAAHVLRSGGTDYVGATFSLLDSWQFHLTRWATDPATSAAWTESGVNAVEAGVKLIS